MDNVQVYEKKVMRQVDERKVYDFKLGIAGLLQAYLMRGEDRLKAREYAVEDAKWVREKAMELATNPL